MDTPTEKRCPRCGRVLPMDAYAIKRNALDGRQTYCRECFKEYFKQYIEAHPPRPKKPADYVPMYRRPIEERREHYRQLYYRRMQMIRSNPQRLAEWRERQHQYMRQYLKKKKIAEENAAALAAFEQEQKGAAQ